MSPSLGWRLCGARELPAWQDALARFESPFRYPLGGESFFRISHGERYGAFFERMGEPLFMFGFEGDEIVAALTGVRKQIFFRGRPRSALYLADLKIAASHRGRGVSESLFRRGLSSVIKRDASFFADSFFYFVAMQGARGDLTRAARAWSPLKFFRPLSRQSIYFAEPASLLKLAAPFAGRDPEPELHLSPAPAGLVSLAGVKDLLLEPSSEALNFGHVGAVVGADGAALLTAAREAREKNLAKLCFAIDRRRAGLTEGLARGGILPAGEARVYALSLDPRLWGTVTAHVGTFEI